MLIEHSRLVELVHYNPETGLFICIKDRPRRNVGQIESKKASIGYIAFCLDGKQYYAHRLAWFYVYGEWPKSEIDHINGIRTDNRLVNLRIATRKQNCGNMPAKSDNRVGLRGVFPNRKRWAAQIRPVTGGKSIHLGTFDTPEQAHERYLSAARKHYGEFVRDSNGSPQH